jgi:predicted house-cleaning noncanonical NTP pyrophosphatase (MazG superfamily)
MKYEKLIRSKVPQDLTARGVLHKTRIAEPEEYKQKLHSKLLEEVTEFFRRPSKEELSDVLEVIEAIKKHHDWDSAEIEEIRLKKREEKGHFEDPIILVES